MAGNLDVWSALEKTDPKHTKGFKRAGGFSGTAIKPIYSIKRLTELFGPCGVGWGMTAPVFQTVNGVNSEILVYCTVGMWHGQPGNLVYGVGGDKVITHIKANEQYKRPERWENDDEAFKKAFTDALMNAAKQIGVGADVHMGMFDDNKYVRQMEREFADEQAGNAQGGQQQKAEDKPQGGSSLAYAWCDPNGAVLVSLPKSLLWLEHAERALHGMAEQDRAAFWDANIHTFERIRVNGQSLRDDVAQRFNQRVNGMVSFLDAMGLKKEPPQGLAA